MGRHKKTEGQRELEILSARVKRDIYREIKTIAKQRDVTLTFLVREALKEFVKNHAGNTEAAA